MRPGSSRPTGADHGPRRTAPGALPSGAWHRAPQSIATQATVALALVAALGLAGCADTPPPDASGEYPDIADSPTDRPAVSSAREREEIAQGLRADRREDRYLLESGTRQRSSEVQPPEYTPPAEAPADLSPAARLDAGETPTGTPTPIMPAENGAAPVMASTAPPSGTTARPDREPMPMPAPEDAANATAPTGADQRYDDALASTPLKPLPGTERNAIARVESGSSVPVSQRRTAPAATPYPARMPSAAPSVAAQPVQTAMAPPAMPMLAPVTNPYASGPIMVDSRGITTMGPGGTVMAQGPYPVGAPASMAAPAYPGAAYAGAAMTPGTPGTQPLTTYAPYAGVRSQRVAVIYFADGSSALSGQDRRVLAQVAALQRQYGGLLRVVGHASSRTGAMDIARHKLANFTISLERANSVAEALMREGVSGRYLFVGAVSDSQPVYYEIMPSGEAGNRRAEIYLDY